MSGDPGVGCARIILAGLFLGLAVRIGENVLETGKLTGLLLLISELLVVILTCVRRRALWVERRLTIRGVAALSIVGPLLVQPVEWPVPVPEMATALVSAVGLAIVVAGKVSLGRSFGLLPANRGVVCTGLYRWIRHPIYLGYLVTHAAFLAAHPTVWNLVLLVTADSALILRATLEERTLARDPRYASYLGQVRWRVLPGML